MCPCSKCVSSYDSHVFEFPLLTMLQRHWENVKDLAQTMAKVMIEANKQYDKVLGTSDSASGPCSTKRRLLSEMEDLLLIVRVCFLMVFVICVLFLWSFFFVSNACAVPVLHVSFFPRTLWWCLILAGTTWIGCRGLRRLMGRLLQRRKRRSLGGIWNA